MAAVVLSVVLSRTGGNGGGDEATGGELFLQNASATGPDPYTDSTARETPVSRPPPTHPTPTEQPTGPNQLHNYAGSAQGLYGGTKKVASCDVERQIAYLSADAAKNSSFASVLGIEPAGVPEHLRSLTPVNLLLDTRVTNHGFRDGRATEYQAVLQRGTAVLIDGRGVPRVRCACGNPLTEPVAQRTAPRPRGEPWPGYQPSKTVVVTPAPRPVKVFVLFDTEKDEWIAREHGDHTGKRDKETKPPPRPATPSVTELPTGPSSPVPSDVRSPAYPSGVTSPAPPSGQSPSRETPTTRTSRPERPPSEPSSPPAPRTSTPEPPAHPTGETSSPEPPGRTPPRSERPESTYSAPAYTQSTPAEPSPTTATRSQTTGSVSEPAPPDEYSEPGASTAPGPATEPPAEPGTPPPAY
ncbi:hypothetical protein PUR26_34015 [Streptomyces sp. SP18CS02]|nr:DUF6777 domain-containing protein [Streptomyces sp. SP18CS02]MEE1757423.1 hypothetical protein [Streptomyces sp. SP18CS02]